MKMHNDVYMGLGVFANILASCTEVYPKETIGLLGGYATRRSNKLVTAFPLQLVKRKRRSVTIINKKSYRRLLRIMDSMNIEFYGFYHSHPDVIAKPSEADLLTSVEKILSLGDDKKLLEIIIEIKRKKYKRRQKPYFQLCEVDTIGGGIFEGYLIEPKNRYDYKYVAEWVEVSRLYYEDAPNRYKVNLNIIEKTVARTWKEADFISK